MNPEHPGSELDPGLVFGDDPVPDEHLEALRREIATLRAGFGGAAAPEPRGDLAQLLGMATDAPATEAVTVVVPIARARSRARRRSRLTRRLAVVAAAVVGAAAVTTGLAAADVLPGPMQRAVHDVLAHAGVDVPPSDPPVVSTTPLSLPPAPGAGSSTPSGGTVASTPTITVTTPPTLPVPGLPVTVPSTLLPPLSLPPVALPGTGGSGLSGSQTTTTTAPGVPISVPGLPLPPLPLLP